VRKFLVAWLAALMLLGALVIPAAAAPKLKDCADIQSTNAAGTQQSRAAYDGTTDSVAGVFFLAANSCKNVTYTLSLVDDDGDTTVIASASVQGSGTDPSVTIEIDNVPATDGDVCAFVTTSVGKKAGDLSPSDGCVVLLDDGTSPGGGKGF